MPPEILTPATLTRSGFVRVSQSEVSGQRIDLYVSAVNGNRIAALVFGVPNHWRAGFPGLLLQQWRWLRLLWGPSRRIRKGRK